MFSCVVGREEHCKQISLSCVGSAPSVWTHWVCHSSQQHVLYRSRLLRLQGALQGHCPKWALCFMHFPGLSCSGSGSWVVHKGTDLVGHAVVPVPGPTHPSDHESTVPGELFVLITSLVPDTWFPGCTARALSQECCVSPLGS